MGKFNFLKGKTKSDHFWEPFPLTREKAAFQAVFYAAVAL